MEVLWSMRNNNIVNQEVNQDNQCIDDLQCVTLGSTGLDLRKKCVSASNCRNEGSVGLVSGTNDQSN